MKESVPTGVFVAIIVVVVAVVGFLGFKLLAPHRETTSGQEMQQRIKAHGGVYQGGPAGSSGRGASGPSAGAVDTSHMTPGSGGSPTSMGR